jgi:hypothetical protein
VSLDLSNYVDVFLQAQVQACSSRSKCVAELHIIEFSLAKHSRTPREDAFNPLGSWLPIDIAKA